MTFQEKRRRRYRGVLKYAAVLIILMTPVTCLTSESGLSESARELGVLDRQFSMVSRQKGLYQAYNEFLGSEGIVLPREGHPVMGLPDFRGTCRFPQRQFRDNLIGWTPERVRVSRSGKIGYTRGRTTRVGPDTGHQPETGIYATLWEKDRRGQWKVAFSQGLYPFFVDNRPPDIQLQVPTGATGRSLVATELAFAREALDYGIPRAFYRFIAREGEAVSGNRIRTRADYHRQVVAPPEKEPEHLLEWKPLVSRVSPAGDLGYNAGPYRFTVYPDPGETRVACGYFFTVWIREDGRWKFLYDAGNRVAGDVPLD